MIDLVNQVLKLIVGEQKYCNLEAVAKLSMHDVVIVPDSQSLRHGTDPSYLIVIYKGWPVATVYPTSLEKLTTQPPAWYDREFVTKVMKTLETYYS